MPCTKLTIYTAGRGRLAAPGMFARHLLPYCPPHPTIFFENYKSHRNAASNIGGARFSTYFVGIIFSIFIEKSTPN